MLEMLNILIDKKPLEIEEGTTILEAARELGIEIPTLCHMNLKDFGIEHNPGGCRICVVEVEGRRNLAPACNTKCYEGMNINTHSMRVLNARNTVMELLLSDHPFDCLICTKSGNCDLQSLANKLGINKITHEGEKSHHKSDQSSSIVRDMDKCIVCRRCLTMCNDVQSVGALSAINRGFESVIAPAFEMKLEDSVCTYCGQCVAVCPTGALTEVNHTRQLIKDLNNPKKTVVVQTAPAVRAAIGEEFGMGAGKLVTGKMVTALRELGFDYIFDTDFAADLTIMEEGTELLGRVSRFLKGDKDVKLPILTSCCPGWVNFFEHQFPELIDIPSTARSPQQMFGSIAKTYWAEKLKIDRKDLVVVSIMPCVAKKYECQRDEFKTDGDPDVNYSITTRELAALIKQANIDFDQLNDEDFDRPLGESTGAGVIFGTTGGVIEAAVRTAYELFTKKRLENVDFKELRGMEGIRKAVIDLDGTKLNIGIAHGLGNARKLLEEIEKGTSEFHAIEIMACPGGCIGGGGQPLHHGDTNILKLRQKAIYSEDSNKSVRKSHENKSVQKVYEEYLGEPMSKKAHELLHTHYFNKRKEIEINE